MEEKISLELAAKSVGETVYKILHTSETGLSDAEAKARLKRDGANVFTPESVSAFELLGRQLLAPLTLMLLAAAVLSFVVGGKIDSIVISVVVILNIVLSFVQEYHAEVATKKLLHKLIPQIEVMRDGEFKEISAREIVAGDIIRLEAGDVVPADARIVSANGVLVDEMMLSGESAPVQKNEKTIRRSVETSNDAENIIFAGTNLLSGIVTAVVFRTGKHSEAGELLALATENPEPSAFEIIVKKLNSFIFKVISISLVIVFIAQMFLHSNMSIPERLLFFVALAILMVPEVLPAVVMITFARGAMKLAKQHVLVRRLSAVEELGHVNVLCVDKTGTLTEGVMKVSEVRGDEDMLMKFVTATVGKHVPHTISGLAYDAALAEHFGKHQHHGEILAVEPFDPIRRRSSKLLKINGKTYIFVSGAPEAVLATSTSAHDGVLDEKDWLQEYRTMGEAGERTLAFGYREFDGKEITARDEKDLIFLGIIGFSDPIRHTAEAAIRAAEALHIEVKILTGDSIEVAEAVARKAGLLAKHERAVTGEEFARANRSEQLTYVRDCKVFARVSPNEKHQIVKLLESDGRRVAFMGDGMNDAPALRAAHVGMAVSSAADIAKSAADIVLMKNGLHVIIDAIGYGRDMFANVRKFLYAALASNFGNFVTATVLSVALPFLPLLPVQILLLNFIGDFPLISVASDRVDVEDRASPRTWNEKEFYYIVIVLGLVSTFFDFLSFGIFHAISPDRFRTLWFMESTFTQILLIFSVRSWRPIWRATAPSLTLTMLTVLGIAMAAITPFTAFGEKYFRFSRPIWSEVVILLILAAGYLFVTEMVKKILKHKIYETKAIKV
ncbi:MAG: cation-transporting P-type ATPase [bacterium]